MARRGTYRIESARLQRARLARGWSVAELAQRLEGAVSVPTIYAIERRRGGVATVQEATLLRLAAALGVPIEALQPPPERKFARSNSGRQKRKRT